MSCTWHASIAIDGDTFSESIDSLTKAREFVAEKVLARGLYLNATDWYRDSEGAWRTRKALAPTVSAELIPAGRLTVPQPRQSTETRG